MLVFSYYYASEVPTPVQEAANYSWVCVLAFCGTACREYTGKWSAAMSMAPALPSGGASDGFLEAVLFYDLLSNIIGSLCMGVLVGCAFFLLPRFPALYAGLTAGFCGCYTTFSSWMSESAAILARGQLTRGLLSLAVGLSLTLHACKLGVTVGAWLGTQLEQLEQRRTQRQRQTRTTSVSSAAVELHGGAAASSGTVELRVETSAGASCGSTSKAPPPPPAAYPIYHSYKLPVGAGLLALLVLGFVGVGAYGTAQPDHALARVSWGLVLSPLFASVRYTLSKHNRHHPMLPRYTLLCNALATALAATCHTLSLAESVGASGPTQMVLGALSLGAAGCLSTVSSFVNEVRLLPSPSAEIYAVLTLVAGQLAAVPIWVGVGYSSGFS